MEAAWQTLGNFRSLAIFRATRGSQKPPTKQPQHCCSNSSGFEYQSISTRPSGISIASFNPRRRNSFQMYRRRRIRCECMSGGAMTNLSRLIVFICTIGFCVGLHNSLLADEGGADICTYQTIFQEPSLPTPSDQSCQKSSRSQFIISYTLSDPMRVKDELEQSPLSCCCRTITGQVCCNYVSFCGGFVPGCLCGSGY